MTADEVLRELAHIARSDVGKAFDAKGRLLPLGEVPEEVRRAISGVETEELFEGHGEERIQSGQTRKVKLWDKVKALELLAKHLGLLRDKVEVSGAGGAPLVVEVRTIGGDS